MAWEKVGNYWLGENLTRRSFYFYYRLQGKNQVYQFFATPGELLGCPIYFARKGQPISTRVRNTLFLPPGKAVRMNLHRRKVHRTSAVAIATNYLDGKHLS